MSSTSMLSYPQTSVDWLTKLIGFNTVSRHSNLELIDYVADYCRTLQLEPRLTFNAKQTKANLFVTVPATVTGKSVVTGGFVLSGHTDVVPVEGQAWDTDPFVATIQGDKLYGRGSCDMKGFLACALTLLPQVVAASQAGQLGKPIHLALSFDEEVGCLGAPLMIEDLKALGIQPEYCIVGEPTMMRMVTAHKGIQVYRCRVHGKSAHSSLTQQGVNAISYASRIIGFIDELAASLRERNDVGFEQDNAFDVPYSTLSVGTIRGGTATNIVPNLCEFTFDYRNLPHMDDSAILQPIQDFIASLLPAMHAVSADTGIELVRQENVPAMNDKDSQALQVLLENLVDDKFRHKVAYATEGGQFTNAGIATVICGPGDIMQAHRANEFVSLEQLAKCDQFLQQILANALNQTLHQL